MNFNAGPRLGSACIKPAFRYEAPGAPDFGVDGVLQYRFNCQQRSLIHELARAKSNTLTERHTSTKKFCLWKSFHETSAALSFQLLRKNSVK